MTNTGISQARSATLPTFHLEGTVLQVKEQLVNTKDGQKLNKQVFLKLEAGIPKRAIIDIYGEKAAVIAQQFKKSTEGNTAGDITCWLSFRPDFLRQGSFLDLAAGQIVGFDCTANVTEATDKYPNPRAFINARHIKLYEAAPIIREATPPIPATKEDLAKGQEILANRSVQDPFGDL